jgi:hypothetical protein
VVAFLPIVTNVATSSDVTVKELYFEGTFPRFGRERTERDLASSGLLCPSVDADMLDSYIRYFHAVGYIRTPLSEELRPPLRDSHLPAVTAWRRSVGSSRGTFVMCGRQAFNPCLPVADCALLCSMGSFY